MTRYIDADAYIKYCEDKWIPLNVDAVTEQPTADVVEVVRCKYCRSFYAELCTETGSPVEPNDYCSYGERRCADV